MGFGQAFITGAREQDVLAFFGYRNHGFNPEKVV